MYKEDLALNNLQWLICHKTKQNPLTHSFTYSLNKSIHLFTVFVISNVYFPEDRSSRDLKSLVENLASFSIHPIHKSNNSYKNLNGTVIKQPEVKCLSYSIKYVKNKSYLYIYIYIYFITVYCCHYLTLLVHGRPNAV